MALYAKRAVKPLRLTALETCSMRTRQPLALTRPIKRTRTGIDDIVGHIRQKPQPKSPIDNNYRFISRAYPRAWAA
jgi:hypothetical protein